MIYVWWGVTGVRKKEDKLARIEKEAELVESQGRD
jgi:hypothetical protein